MAGTVDLHQVQDLAHFARGDEPLAEVAPQRRLHTLHFRLVRLGFFTSFVRPGLRASTSAALGCGRPRPFLEAASRVTSRVGGHALEGGVGGDGALELFPEALRVLRREGEGVARRAKLAAGAAAGAGGHGEGCKVLGRKHRRTALRLARTSLGLGRGGLGGVEGRPKARERGLEGRLGLERRRGERVHRPVSIRVGLEGVGVDGRVPVVDRGRARERKSGQP
mmetsp:Transcript_68913/g.155907  ORF Transcript_68913/g.155907 Transcript_68913/m.155907 type:complete len:223 (-) Transcript_68913:434-1102(-)